MNVWTALFFLFITVLPGQVIELRAQDSLTVSKDTSSVVDVRLPQSSAIQKYAEDPDFQYTQAAPNPDSFTSRLLGFIIRTLSFIFGNPAGNFILKVLLYLTIAGLVFVLVNQVIGGNLINVFTKKNAGKPISLNIAEEDLEDLDLHKLLEDAVRRSDYHAATRYVYLITLKMLNSKGLISWGIQKTNLDYEQELRGHSVSPLFRSLTTYYEFVEYGDFNIDKAGFKRVQSIYNSLEDKVKA